MNGNLLLIYKGGQLIAGTRSNEIQTEAETIEVSTPTSGAWREYIEGRKTWSVNVNYLVTTEAEVDGLLDVGTAYALSIVTRSGSGTTTATSSRLTGSAILKTCKITATRGNLIQGSFQFIGSGELAEVSDPEASDSGLE